MVAKGTHPGQALRRRCKCGEQNAQATSEEGTHMPLIGSCHCGAIRYEADVEPTEAITCNCSICRRKGSVLAFAPVDRFTLLTSRDAISVYTFRSHNIRHQFCKVCGCAPISEGTAPDGRAMVALNLRCAEGIDLKALKITEYDGASIP
jgi:hypothetical protein